MFVENLRKLDFKLVYKCLHMLIKIFVFGRKICRCYPAVLLYSRSVLDSVEQCQISETALFSAEYLWDFNPGVDRIELNKYLFPQRHKHEDFKRSKIFNFN